MTDPGPYDDESRTLWQRFVGGVDRIGWWTLPAFLAVGLAGAVMAAALAIVYYSQQVSDLESQTREGRQELQGAVDEVRDVRDRALEDIQSEVDAVRQTLALRQPIEDVSTLGLVVLEVRVTATASDRGATAPAGESPNGAPAVLAQEQETSTEQDPTEPSGTSSPEPQPEPQPDPPPERPRLGVGFTVAVEDAGTFIATSYDLVHDPQAPGGVAEEVRITTMEGDQVTGTVHSWGEEEGLALVRAPAGELPIGNWRPRGEDLAVGDRLTVVGITPRMDPVQLDGVVGSATRNAIVTTLPDAEFLRGAPVVDITGRVVGVYAPGYRPFGQAAGTSQAIPPVGLFCERMLTGCESLEAEADPRPTDEPTG